MPLHRTYLLVPLLLTVWSLAPSFRQVNAQALAPLLVVVARASGISNIDSGTLRRVFKGYPTDLDGKRLVPFNHNVGAADRVRFDNVVLGLTPDQMGRFWVDQKIRQVSLPPRTVPTVELLLRVVASLPGAITYIARAPERLPAETRAIAVDGKTPSAPDYPLRGN